MPEMTFAELKGLFPQAQFLGEEFDGAGESIAGPIRIDGSDLGHWGPGRDEDWILLDGVKYSLVREKAPSAEEPWACPDCGSAVWPLEKECRNCGWFF